MKAIILELICRTISISRFFITKSINTYFYKEKKLEIKYPTIITANHVSELDVVTMLYVHRFTNFETNLTVPAREDILQKEFLQKEFPTKGFLRLLFKFIDFTSFIPFLLKFINAIPVKRPFRDNSRNLAKSGRLREEVNSNWELITEYIKKGSNVFLFPEGTFTYNGYLTNPKKGVFLIGERIKDLNIINVSLCYDYITFSRPDVHILIGQLENYPTDLDRENTGKFIRDKIGKGMVLTHGNLVSFTLFLNDFKNGISPEKFKIKFIELVNKIKTTNLFSLSFRFQRKNFYKLVSIIISKAIKMKFVEIKENKMYSTEKLFNIPNHFNSAFLKNNPFYYHKNQLSYHEKKISNLWEKLS